GAAGAVDVHDHGAGARFPEPLQRLDPLLIAADKARDRDAGDRAAGRARQHAGAGSAQRGADRDHGADGDEHGQHAPEGELAPHPATIDDGIGIERHGLISSERSGARVPLSAATVNDAQEAAALWQIEEAARTKPVAWSARPLGCDVLPRRHHLPRYSSSSFFSAGFSVARLSAVPRMSPSVAPESEEPYWAIASFSSATSSALIEACTLWERRSNWMTRASTFCPMANRSGRCSPRSRASSERLMKVVRSPPTIFTSRPASFTSTTSQVTTEPFLRSPALSMGSPSSCLIPSEMRSFSTSTSSTLALTLSPFLYSSITCSPGRFQSRSERWTMPSTSPSRPRNSPNSVLFLTSPSSTDPGGY